MNIARHFAEQLARPRGAAGRVLGALMDIANRKAVQLSIERLAPRDGESLLDAGCGTGAALSAVLDQARCELTGIDPSETMIEAARRKLGKRARLQVTGMENLPFPDDSFDAVIALNVFYFLDADGVMVRSLRRVLKPGGRLIAYVTKGETMQQWSFARAGIHRLYDATTLAQAVAAGGFNQDQICVEEARIVGSVKGLFVRAIK